MDTVWVFLGEGASLPAGFFADEASARRWIRGHGLTGLLTEYPVGLGLYDYAIERGTFRPKSPSHREPWFIGRFNSAHVNHYHFEDGSEPGDDSGS